MLDIDSIIVEPRKRSVGDTSELAESITALGLLNPVTVIIKESATKILSDEKDTILVAGASLYRPEPARWGEYFQGWQNCTRCGGTHG